ncbi:MAG: PocR ligand-binding domain-containing protein [bacterium]
MINWTHAALLPAARRIARYIQEEWGVWVGIASVDGQIVTFPRPGNMGARPICEHFAANRSAQGSTRTCAAAIQSWVDNDEHKPKRCHVGLSAISVPIVRKQHTLAVVYASGFFHAEDASPGVHRVTDSLALAGLDASATEAWVDDVPRLDRRKRDVIHGLLRGDCIGHREPRRRDHRTRGATCRPIRRHGRPK